MIIMLKTQIFTGSIGQLVVLNPKLSTIAFHAMPYNFFRAEHAFGDLCINAFSFQFPNESLLASFISN